VQLVQTPAEPQVAGASPTAQVPPVAAVQQPPLQTSVDEHEVEHAPPVPQASFAAQSVATVQPHVPPGRHAVPVEEAAHESHIPPEAPHADCEVPTSHVPALQQPPWQSCVDEHALVHACVARSHALPTGQSAGDAQPEGASDEQVVQASAPEPPSLLESWPPPTSRGGCSAWASMDESSEASTVASAEASDPAPPHGPMQLPCSSSEHPKPAMAKAAQKNDAAMCVRLRVCLSTVFGD
jgi:hypothetical protein